MTETVPILEIVRQMRQLTEESRDLDDSDLYHDTGKSSSFALLWDELEKYDIPWETYQSPKP